MTLELIETKLGFYASHSGSEATIGKELNIFLISTCNYKVGKNQICNFDNQLQNPTTETEKNI